MSDELLLKEKIERPGVWFIRPYQAFILKILSPFRKRKYKIYRNPGLDIEGDHKTKEIFWQAYLVGCTWLKEEYVEPNIIERSAP